MPTFANTEAEPTEEVSNLMKPEVQEARPLTEWEQAMRIAP